MIELIVLAGGNSRRFSQNKLTHCVEGKPLVSYTIDRFKNAEEFLLTVVTQYESIYRYCKDNDVNCVLSDTCREGISYSIKAGIEEISRRNPSEVIFTAGDQPFISKDRMLDFYNKYISSGCGMASCFTDDHPSNPTIFSSKYFKDLVSLKGDKGGRTLIQRYSEDCLFYTVDNHEELLDIDYLRHLDEFKDLFIKIKQTTKYEKGK